MCYFSCAAIHQQCDIRLNAEEGLAAEQELEGCSKDRVISNPGFMKKMLIGVFTKNLEILDPLYKVFHVKYCECSAC